MAEDWLVARISVVEQAAANARRALGRASEVLAPAVDERRRGVPLMEIAQRLVERGAGARHDASDAVRDFDRAVAELRSAVVRALVDEEGVSLSELARRMGISRQAATRLYQRAVDR